MSIHNQGRVSVEPQPVLHRIIPNEVGLSNADGAKFLLGVKRLKQLVYWAVLKGIKRALRNREPPSNSSNSPEVSGVDNLPITAEAQHALDATPGRTLGVLLAYKTILDCVDPTKQDGDLDRELAGQLEDYLKQTAWNAVVEDNTSGQSKRVERQQTSRMQRRRHHDQRSE